MNSHAYCPLCPIIFVIFSRDLLRGSPDSFSSALLLYTVQQGWALMQSDPGSVSGREIKELRDLAAQAMTIADTGQSMFPTDMWPYKHRCMLYQMCGPINTGAWLQSFVIPSVLS